MSTKSDRKKEEVWTKGFWSGGEENRTQVCVCVRARAACLTVMWRVLALICFIFPNKLFMRRTCRWSSEKDEAERATASWGRGSSLKRKLNNQTSVSFTELFKRGGGLLARHANHRLTGRAGCDFTGAGTQSHKKTVWASATSTANLVADVRPPTLLSDIIHLVWLHRAKD